MGEGMGDLLPNGRERTGIVEAAAAMRARHTRNISRTVAAALESGEVRAYIAKAIGDGIKREVDAIMARQRDALAAELADIAPPSGPPIKALLQAVEAATGIGIPDLMGAGRRRELSWPRFMAYALIRKHRPDLSLPAIGRAFGERDHTTIMHGLRRFAALKDSKPFTDWLAHPAIAALAERGKA